MHHILIIILLVNHFLFLNHLIYPPSAASHFLLFTDHNQLIPMFFNIILNNLHVSCVLHHAIYLKELQFLFTQDTLHVPSHQTAQYVPFHELGKYQNSMHYVLLVNHQIRFSTIVNRPL
jgi:hypothetical protein